MQVVKSFEKASNRKVVYKITARRDGDIGTCYADPRKAKLKLNWEVKHGLDEMCEDAWRFASKTL